MAGSLAELLAQGAVRIDIGGKPNGTGFFISPTHVITCAHVLEEYLATSSGARPSLDIVDSQDRTHAIVGSPRIAADVDLALLQLAQADTTVAVVWLDERFEVRDEMVSFGYPESHPEGEPTTFKVEGQSGGPAPHIKFKSGQVRPGVSGSALLNLRTGAVCGVVRKTRNERTDLGGYGIPVSTLHAKFDDVPRLNAEAIRADRRWANLLSPEQRRRVNVPVSALAEPNCVEYVVSVSQQDDQWLVAGFEAPNGEAAEIVVDLNTVRAEVPRLFRAWKAQGRIDDAEQSRLLGHVLYRAIMPNGVGGQLERLAFEEKRTVHVSLCFADEMDADLTHLPWEQLFVRGRSLEAPLGETRQATLTRVSAPEPDPQPPSSPSTASALVVMAPSESHSIVSAATKELFRELGTLSNIVLAKNPGAPSVDDLTDLVQAEGADIVHYIGFGRYQDNRDELALTDPESSDAGYVDARQLAEALMRRPPKLVVLQTCGLTAGTVPADPTALAMTLVRNGVEAVVAFPYPLTAELAGKASSRLYKQLDAGAQIRVAVQDARRSTSFRASPWSRPALFMSRPTSMALVARQ